MAKKTPEEKAAVLDAVRAASKAFAQATARSMRLKTELDAANKEAAVAFKALQDTRTTLKKESEGDDAN